jgi:hypothetical protein
LHAAPDAKVVRRQPAANFEFDLLWLFASFVSMDDAVILTCGFQTNKTAATSEFGLSSIDVLPSCFCELP